MQTRRAFVLLLVLCALALTAASPKKSRVVKEVVLATYSEDITYIRSGPYAHHVAFLEDLKVVGYPASRFGNDAIKTLFDFSGFLAVQPSFRPNGLAYVESEQRFAIISRSIKDKMFLFDANGRLGPTRTIEYPPEYVPAYVEGLEYIPPDAGLFPDHLALCTGMVNPATGNMTSDILILRRDGTLAHRVPVPFSDPSNPYAECLAVGFQAPDRLLVSGADGDWLTVTTMDFDGHVVGSPVRMGTPIEGIVALQGGEVLTVGGRGIIYSLDGNLTRQPSRDRPYRPDTGTGGGMGLAWDSGRNLFVVAGRPLDGSGVFALFDLPPTFTGATKFADLCCGPGLYYHGGPTTFLPDEQLIAVRQNQRFSPSHPQFVPASILLFRSSDGQLTETIDLRPLGLGSPRALAWLPDSERFAVSFPGPSPGERGIVHLLDRWGSHVGTIDYSATITAVVTSLAVFDPPAPSGSRLLISAGPTLFIGDLAGNVTGQFPATEIVGTMSVTDLATVTSGPYAGTFAAIGSSQMGSIDMLFLFRADTP